MELAPGTVFASDYEVQRELSAGGMGRVYVVLQKSTGKQRALKLMLPQLVSDPSLRKRFEQEARVASLIESDHVVEVVGAGIDEPTGAPWLAMELLKGGVLTPIQPLPALHRILREVCHAVGAAHAAGIVHRDLKPENIFLAESKRAGEQRTVKVLDFGIAKIAAEASTQHTAAMGSPIWMAPEQTDKGVITPAADVWALGLVTYNLLTGKYFWNSAEDGGTVHQVMKEILFAPIPPASQRAAEQGVAALLPPWFDTWFAGCMNRDPQQRFPNATTMFAAFESYMAASASLPPTVLAPPVTGPPPAYSAMPNAPTLLATMTAPAVVHASTPPPPARPRRFRRIMTIGLLAFACFMLSVAGRKKWRDFIDPQPRSGAESTLRGSDGARGRDAPMPMPMPALSLPAPVDSAAINDLIASAMSDEQDKDPDFHTPWPKKGPVVDADGFQRTLASQRVAAVNLQPCADAEGAAPGTHAVVTYDSDGTVTEVQLDSSTMRDTPAARCVEQRLKKPETRIPSFRGSTKKRVLRSLF